MTITGECFCGAIRYEIVGGLEDARSCHCSRCRKAFSSQASVYALVDPDDFRWVSGEQLLTTYNGGQGFGLSFCSTCGSTLCGTFQGRVHGVTLGCVNGDPGIEIQRHIFTGSRAPWERLPEGIVAFEEGPDGPARVPRVKLSGFILVPEADLEAVESELVNHIRLTREEPGCVSFDVTPSVFAAHRFDVREEFEDRAAFDRHQLRVQSSRWGSVAANVERHYVITEE